MNQRIERLLENWLLNTVRHCRATRLFDMEIRNLNRSEQIALANTCLDFFESETERLLAKRKGNSASGCLPSPPKGGEDGSGGRSMLLGYRGR